jgi:hypothetical protein
MEETNPTLSEFLYVKAGRTYYFNDFESLKNFRIGKTKPCLRPFVRLRDDFQRAKERYYESKFNLPPKYLAGMYYQKPPGYSANKFAREAKEGLSHERLQEYLRVILTASFERATKELVRHIVKNRRLVESHMTQEVIRTKVERAREKQTHAFRHQSLPEDLVINTSSIEKEIEGSPFAEPERKKIHSSSTTIEILH